MKFAIRIILILVLIGAGFFAWQKIAGSRANNQGVEAINRGDYAAAIVHLEKARKSNPNNASVLKNLGYAYGETGDTDNAIGAYEAALRANPEQPETRERLEVLKVNQGYLDRAAERVARLKAQGWKADATLQETMDVAEVSFQIGKWKDAIILFERALFLDPPPEQVLEIESKIEYMERKIADGTAP